MIRIKNFAVLTNY